MMNPLSRLAVTALIWSIVLSLGATALAQPAPVFALAASAFVRVNQVGFQAVGSKRAYLLAGASEDGAAFRLVSAGGAIVYSAAIGSNLGAWSADFPFVYALDFDAVTGPGTYSIIVDRPVPASSPDFKIDTPANLYTFMLSYDLFFYQAQRDGPNVIPSVMNRQPAHLNDAAALPYLPPKYTPNGVLIGDLVPVSGGKPRDVSGGWFDAGDYIKGVETASYANDLLLIAVRDHPRLLGPGSAANFSAEAKFGLDWLRKMWDDQTRTLYYQVAIGDANSQIIADHDLWRLPQADDTYAGNDRHYRYIRHRPVFRAGPPGSLISPNLAGRMAAAFALGYQVYRGSDPVLARQLLMSAEHIYDLANTHPTGNLTTFSPFDFYPEMEWRSDLELGAVELAVALAAEGPGGGDAPAGLPHANPRFYLNQAAEWARAYIKSPDDGTDTLNLYDVSSLAHYELARAIAQVGSPSGLAVTRADLVGDIQKQLQTAVAQAATDPFGYGLSYANFDGTSHAQGLAIMSSFYDELTGTSAYADFGRRQLGIILGSNAWGTSFIVGAGTTFPHCIHHQIANLIGALDGTSPILKGAPVNGTNSTGVFSGLGLPDGARACPPDGSDAFAAFNGMSARWYDNVVSWPTVEPAIDFAASTPLAFARQIAGLP